jgi:adenine-specific DNA-methyltransferase
LQAPLVARLAEMTHRLADWGYTVSTGPLVWNRFKDQLAHQPGRNRHPLIWAEAVTSDGRFVYRADKKNHAPYFEIRRGDEWLIVDYPCVLLQRTTAKEQARRLIAALLPEEFLARHGAVVVENHLNMLRPIVESPAVPADVLAAFLNSSAADRAFRCVSGSVAVSAYELETLPLPSPEDLGDLRRLVRNRASRSRIEVTAARLYDNGP